MNGDWFATLSGQLDDAADAPSPGVWTALRHRTNPLEQTPRPNAHAIIRELTDRHGPYFVLKNTAAKTYLRLSPTEHRLWTHLDGQTSVQELIVNLFMETGEFAHARVTHFIHQLHAHQMLGEKPLAVWRMVAQAVQRQSWGYRLAAPAQFFLTRKLNLNGLDGAMGTLYRTGGWVFFTRPVQVIFALVSVLGMVAFLNVVRAESYAFIGGNVVIGLAWVWVASLLPVVIHELGHALTVKHFGREVPRGGLMLYFGMPAAFMETTDIWLEPRRARLAVTWNGPYTGLILGGAVGLWLYFFPTAPVNAFLFRMAGFAYATVFFNANPLLKFDGYYLLADALEIHALRARSLDFVRKGLFHKIAERTPLTREEWIFTVYGVLSTLWMGYAVVLAGYFWQTRVREGVQVMLGRGYSLVARGLGFLLTAAMVSLLVLILVGVGRLGKALAARFVASGGLTRYGLVAALLGGGAVVGGGVIPLLFPKAMLGLEILAAGCAWRMAFRLLAFNRPYRGSWRGAVQGVWVGALILGGLAMIWPQELIAWGVAGLLCFAGVMLARGMSWRVGGMGLLVGVAIGCGGYFGLGMGHVPRVWAMIGLATAGVWAWGNLRGGARATAVGLMFAGGMLLVGGWLLPFSRLTGVFLLAAGGEHLTLAQLPKLFGYEQEGVSGTASAMRQAAAGMVRRVIAQVFFEMGGRGVQRLEKAFAGEMHRLGVTVRITGGQFEDQAVRQADELAGVYGVVFEALRGWLGRELGEVTGRATFAYGMDLLPWQNREVMVEWLLGRGVGTDGQEERRALLKRVPLFVGLEAAELDLIARRLQRERFGVGERVIRQGEMGEKFYVVAQGRAAIWQTDAEGVTRKMAQCGAGQFFGEVALMSARSRNATVQAETPLTVYSLAKKDFDALVRTLAENFHPGVRHSWLLRGMPLFDALESHELDWLALQMERETFHMGEVVFCEGDPGDKFYIIESGQVVVTRKIQGETVELARRGTGEYVGEIALLQHRPRTATITACEETTLYSLEAVYFQDLVAGYARLGEALAQTGSRRLGFVEAVEAAEAAGISPRREE